MGKKQSKPTILRTQQAANILGVVPGTLREKYKPYLIEGLHYFKPSSKSLRFYEEPLTHWFENRQNPDHHKKWLEQYWLRQSAA